MAGVRVMRPTGHDNDLPGGSPCDAILSNAAFRPAGIL